MTLIGRDAQHPDFAWYNDGFIMRQLSSEVLQRIRACCRDDSAFDQVLQILNGGPEHQSEDAAAPLPDAIYRTLFNVMAEGIMLCDVDSTVRMCNAAAARALGMSEADLVGTRLAEREWLLYREDGTRFSREDFPAQKALATGQPQRGFIVRYLYEEGSFPVWMSMSAELVFDPGQNQPRYVVISFSDITELKRLEEILRRSRERYRAVVDTQTELISRCRPDTMITFANDAFCRYFGRSRSQLIGHSILDCFPEPQRALMRDHLHSLAENPRSAVQELQVMDAEGRVGWQQWVDEVIIDDQGRAIEIQSVCRDITERKNVELALRESEERFRQIAESISEVFYVRDHASGQVSYISPAYEKLWGEKIADLYTDSRAFLRLIHPDDYKRIRTLARERSPILRDIEFRITTAAKGVRWIRVRDFPIKDQDGGARRMAGIIEDITERKRAEQQQLELAVEREQRRVTSDFIRDASHEFRTPLSIINTSLHLLGRGLDEERQKRVEKIMEQVHSITDLVDALLAMSRLDSDAPFRFDPLRVNDMVERIRIRLGDVIEARGLTLVVQMGNDLPLVYGDDSQLDLALRNMVDNAIRYTPAGGTITLRTLHVGDMVAIDIQDSGVGIAPEVQPRIFERFFRVDDAHTTAGFGLGLSMAERVITRHSGRIEVTSAPGEGSLFRVLLPAHDPSTTTYGLIDAS